MRRNFNMYLVLTVSYFASSLLLDAKPEFKHSQKILQRTLANHAVLLHQTLNYHWNVEGKEFHDYHLLFDKEYHELFKNLDLIAERLRAVGGKAAASMKHFIDTASIQEDNGPTPEASVMIKKLHDQYHRVIEDMRKAVKDLEKSGDIATRKVLEDLVEMDEKITWMLKSLLKK
ncbi:DNA starvation/stationary phase protection protein [Candidatus Dependentiae bacterium]|nr:DNA starvation/stationary phase protection protein [Candidatus Dependentiae bacterium]